MIGRLAVAVAWAVIVTLLCILLGAILVDLKVEIAVTVGRFLTQWAAVLGVLAGILQFFGGWGPSWPARP